MNTASSSELSKTKYQTKKSIADCVLDSEIQQFKVMDNALNHSKKTIAESQEQLQWSISNRNQEKIINQYMDRERTLLAQLDLSRANIKAAEGTRKLLQEHTLMLHDAQAKADAMQKAYNDILTRQHQAEATIDIQKGKLIEYKDRWMVSHSKNRQMQEKINTFETRVPKLELELKRKTELLNKYDEMLFDSTMRINDLKTENGNLKENVKHAKFLMEIINKMSNRCMNLKEQIIHILSKDKKLVYAYIRNDGNEQNINHEKGDTNCTVEDISNNAVVTNRSSYSSYDQKILGEIDSLIDFTTNLCTVATSYNGKG